jgi:protocatechuate 3,4-dioxygenase beta subunit
METRLRATGTIPRWPSPPDPEVVMQEPNVPDESRRNFLRTLVAAPLAFAAPAVLGSAAACGDATGNTPIDTSQPTLACEDDDDDDPTVAQTEGPYFTPNSPERTSLLTAGVDGSRLTLAGLVVTRSCAPVEGALLDFWQADEDGEYDNSGYTLRGHQYTDASGAYRLETIVPGLYPGRTRHIHVKVQAPNRPILTTQLYFPGETRNASDGIFHSSLLMQITETVEGREGVFHFVLDLP